MSVIEMAAQLFNRIGQMGLGVALVGGVVNSALYNGMFYFHRIPTWSVCSHDIIIVYILLLAAKVEHDKVH